MRAALLALMTLGAAFAQVDVADAASIPYEARAIQFTVLAQAVPPAPVITTYTSQVIGASVGVMTCNTYGQHPGAGQVQLWCTVNGTTVVNAVFTVSSTLNIGISCVAVNPVAGGNLALALIPATSPMIGYQIGAQAFSAGLPFRFGLIGPADPNNLAVEGTF